jgi:MinD-like ATPase involved in chromosome partitioning or flagellar assembly
VRPSAAEVAEKLRLAAFIENQTTIRQAVWTRAVSVLIANPKGGAGKTPTSLCLAGVLADLRGNVVVVEVSDDPGKLLFRAEHERTPDLGLGELVRDVDQIATAGQLAGYTALQSTRAHVVGTPGRRPPLDGAAVHEVMAKLDEFYSIRVMDSGNQYTSSAFVAALEATDVLVIPITAGGDAATDARLLLDELREMGGHPADLARNAVVVRLIDGRTEHGHVLSDIDRMLDLYEIENRLTIPYDQHIADRQQITFDRLANDTKEAFTALGATVVRQLQKAVAPVLSAPVRAPERAPAADPVKVPDEAADVPAPVPAATPTAPVVVPELAAEPADEESWVQCPECGASVPDAPFCSRCGHQMASELNLDKLYVRGRRAAGYAEPTEAVRNHLTPVPSTRDENADTQSARS